MKRRLVLAASTIALVPALLAAPGCSQTPGRRDWQECCPAQADPRRSEYDLSLDRGNWLVGTPGGVWKVLEEQSPSAPPVHIGYVTERSYREVRGGPAFPIFEVTRLDRNDQIGMIDSLGNATRFLPRRGGGIETVKAGNSTMALNVQAVFDTIHAVTLQRTSERQIAFETLDTNRDGALAKEEFPRILESPSPDRNGDGKVDFQEFDAIDRL
jgi:hypothetical protein